MNRHLQRGFILITSLIILLVISLLALYMFGGFTQDEKISGNTREKARAVDAANSALNQAQYWMGLPNTVYANGWNTGVVCGAPSATPVVCSNVLADPRSMTWPAGTSLTPPGMTVDADGGVANTYAGATRYHIQYIETVGTSPGAGMYRVTATASGGNANAVAVQQGIFQVTTDSQDIGGG